MDKLSFILRHPHYGHVFPIRVMLDTFTPNSSQATCLKRNEDTLTQVFRRFSDCPQADAHKDLVRGWLAARHGHDPRDKFSPNEGQPLLTITHQDSEEPLAGIMFKEHAYAIEASMLYYNTSPALKRRSLGTYAILQLIELAKAHRHSYVNLGLWTPRLENKLAYKTNFRPCQIWTGAKWENFKPLSPT